MATYTIDQYQRKMRNLAKNIRKAAKTSTNATAQFMVTTARGLAPAKTGALRRNIIAKSIKGAEFQVTSIVPKTFPYHFWINQTAPMRTIHPWWNRYQPTAYGDGTHTITGSPRYWHFATLRTIKLFGRITRKNIQKTLKVRLI